jgi:diadenosine tetraphosphate (Ap4A) HIT family hydrolase
MNCELCTPTDLLLENEQAYVQFERDSLSRGHVIVVPRRHVADFFQMSPGEHEAVNQLLREAHAYITTRFSPDGFNVGINVGKAAGQNRMHVHVHLIPRYSGDVADPKGGVRAVLRKT